MTVDIRFELKISSYVQIAVIILPVVPYDSSFVPYGGHTLFTRDKFAL